MRVPAAKAPPLNPELKEHVAHNLIRCREAAGISQEELSYRASLNRTEISLLERGQRMPRIDTAVRVAGSLGIPLDELVVGIKWEPGYVIVKVGEWVSEAPPPREPQADSGKAEE